MILRFRRMQSRPMCNCVGRDCTQPHSYTHIATICVHVVHVRLQYVCTTKGTTCATPQAKHVAWQLVRSRVFNLACSRRQMALTCSDCRGPSHCLPSITCLTSSLTKIVFTLHLLCLTFLYLSSNRPAFSQCVVSIYLCFLL